MIHDILEFIRSMEDLLPLGSHPTCWAPWIAQVKDRWKHTFHDTADTALDPIQREEADWILYGILDYRQALHDAAWERMCRAEDPPHPPQKQIHKDTSWKGLFDQPQIPQRTAEWYAEAKTILTASEFSKLFETPRVWSALVLSKAEGAAAAASPKPPSRLACSRAEMNALDWGTCLESVVKQVLAREKGWEIRDLGRIRHRGGLPIAASPDGILVNGPFAGNLIEIKCPLSRVLDRSTIPFEYWCQMQIQMEVTDRPACEYVEMKFDLKVAEEDDAAIDRPLADNELALVQDTETFECFYVYEGYPSSDTRIVLERMRWTVEEFRHTRVQRDTAWFASIRPTLTQFWIDVGAARCGTWKAPPPLERKKPKPVFCSIVDSPPEPSSPRALDEEVASPNDTTVSTPPIASSE